MSDSARNYAVLHIVIDESRIFKTKERAPVMLTLEVFRPIELSLHKKPKMVVADEEMSETFSAQTLLQVSRPSKKASSSFVD